jgi:DNA-binding GntR family transcriptional regulator
MTSPGRESLRGSRAAGSQEPSDLVNWHGITELRSATAPRLGRDRTLERLDLSSLRDQANAAIRGGIVSGAIAGGRTYSVSYFADQLGVSATPIREALFDLVTDGLMELVRNRGFLVPNLSEHDLDELFDLRLLIELPATTRLAAQRPPINASLLGQLAVDIEEHARGGDLVGFLWADRQFHLTLLYSLGNLRLVKTVASLRDQVRLQGLRKLAETGRLETSAHEHAELLQGILAGDVELTSSVMLSHMRHTRGIWVGRHE